MGLVDAAIAKAQKVAKNFSRAAAAQWTPLRSIRWSLELCHHEISSGNFSSVAAPSLAGGVLAVVLQCWSVPATSD
jgi:hypothetical protein